MIFITLWRRWRRQRPRRSWSMDTVWLRMRWIATIRLVKHSIIITCAYITPKHTSEIIMQHQKICHLIQLLLDQMYLYTLIEFSHVNTANMIRTHSVSTHYQADKLSHRVLFELTHGNCAWNFSTKNSSGDAPSKINCNANESDAITILWLESYHQR